MFSFRRRTAKKQVNNGPPFIRTSPSLPDLSAEGVQWPESLIDVSELPPATETLRSHGKRAQNPEGGPISSLYMSHPPSAFDNRKSSYRNRPSQRKNRNPPTFNIMVAGAQGTGKTSLLRLLLETADMSPTATAEQKTAMHLFLRGPPKRTDSIQSATVEICESKYDRILLTVVDTPGLDFQEGHELKLERQVSSIVKYLDTQFAETLSEESKVVRQSKGDQHVHLCIYTIDPASIITPAERRSLSSFPTTTRSEATISPPELTTASDDSLSDESEDELGEDISVSPIDIAVMKRLAKKSNLLPVISHADCLTDDKLTAIKNVVRRDLDAAGLDFGVFGPINSGANKREKDANGNGNGHGVKADGVNGSANGDSHNEEDDATEEPEEERQSRPVIKLKQSRNPFKLRFNSRSRSRLDLTDSANEPATAEITDNESVASIRFSAHIVSKVGLSDILPFTVIAPEYNPRRTRVRQLSQLSQFAPDDRQSIHTDTGTSAVSPSDDGHGPGSIVHSPVSPTLGATRNLAFLSGPPADLRGVFVRKFRWGTVDVLSPEHCDFAALRTAVLSTHMKMLKVRTKEVLYEKFRTEKLLARRATRNISEDDTRRMFEEIGL